MGKADKLNYYFYYPEEWHTEIVQLLNTLGNMGSISASVDHVLSQHNLEANQEHTQVRLLASVVLSERFKSKDLIVKK